ncbi:MAG: hypothetical protein ACK4IY_04930 [Chitinophagales bacterium]
MQRIVFCFLYLCILLTGCSQKKNAEKLADGLCDCAQPILKWRAGLQSDPSSFSKGNVVKMQVDSCLNAYTGLYQKYQGDAEFIEAVKTQVNVECAPASGSVNAMLQMLSEK